MSKTLTWKFLTLAHMAKLGTTTDPAAVRAVLLEAADAQAKGAWFGHLDLRDVLVDLLYHALRFARSHGMTAEKQSTFVSIMYQLHTDAMASQASAKDAFAIFEDILIGHSVHRPPYSAAVFAVDDTKLIVDYVVSTYFRHYKLYLYAFSFRNELVVSAHTLGVVNETPFEAPPLALAVPLAQWEIAKAEEQRKRELEERAEAEQAAARAAQEEAQRQAELDGPPMPAGLKAQLAAIRQQVAQASGDRLQELDLRLAVLEAKLQNDSGKPSSSVGGSKARAAANAPRK